MSKRLILFLVIVVCSLKVGAQVISLDYDSKPLNKVLIELRNKYDIRFSYDDSLLSTYNVSVHSSAKTIERAVQLLLDNFPLDYDVADDVYVIFPHHDNLIKPTKKTCLFSGYVLEKNSGEALPFSNVTINEKTISSGMTGYFAELVSCDSTIHVKVSHLGYFILDTILDYAKLHTLYLQPVSIELKEVEIVGSSVDFRSQIGQLPGVIKLNSKVATHLPGYGDNSVFNLLRLQPGILASGEQTNELIIRGSYAGQSMVQFDGFTVFGLKNFNDNISSFNPLMAKDIEVLKSGFDARYGERVGGIVNVTGKTGNTDHVSFIFNVNNMTLNSMIEIPIRKRSSLIIAFRNTYFDLYNPSKHTWKNSDTTSSINSVDINVIPDYIFRDLNIKYSGKTKSGNLYYVSLYSGNDDFSYKIDQQVYFRKVLKQTDEQSLQFGASAYYSKIWKNGWSENFTLSVSSLKENYYNHYRITKLWNNKTDTLDWVLSLNQITEFNAHTDLVSPISHTHTLEWGGGLLSNQSLLHADTFGVSANNMSLKGSRSYMYMQDKISVGTKLTLRIGGRLNYAVNLARWYAEPRFSAIFNANEYWKINFATGIYHQFIAKTSVLDNEGNYHYLWAICNNKDIPVLQSVHNVLGLSFFKNGWTISAETYHKHTTGLSRFVTYKNIIAPDNYYGNSYSYGLDVMFKKDFKGNSLWIAYSLAKTEEHFEYFPNDEYKRAPQDQRHELKLAVIVNLYPFFVSANYVYGTGFPSTFTQQQRIQANYPYSRLDGAVSYRFLNRKLVGEAGISVLNILNTDNIKFANFERVPLNQTSGINIYAQSIPFTPTIYINISL